ncbi:MAG: toprim domain-containing protein [Bacteroidetes bacterium]|nr:toprim domain-containing protein [Bacteroidota bacterium]
MNNHYDAKTIKDQVSIVELLAALGYKPVKTSGNEQLYLSPLRDSDTKPSFSVNEGLGWWYEHYLGIGGNVIELGMQFWPKLPFPELLAKIAETVKVTPGQLINGPKRKRITAKEPNYRIETVKELGNSYALMQFLQSRGVWEAAQGIVKEVYYYIEDEQHKRRNFFAAGLQNELGAWNVRNRAFKGCLGHNAISFIPADEKRICVFEGFMDYLSWRTGDPFCGDSILVLNSLSLIPSGISKAKSFANISTYFDNDQAGIAATEAFRFALPQSVDCSWIYEGYKDYNEKLQATLTSTGQHNAWQR